MRFVENIDTAATPAEAFPFLVDFNNLPKWDPSIVRVEQLDEGPVEVDTRFRVTLRFLGFESALDYRVDEYEPNHRAVLIGTATTVTATDSITVEARGAGSRVTWDADIRFPFPMSLLDPVFEWFFASNVRDAVTNLLRVLDKQARAGKRTKSKRDAATAVN